MLVQEQESLVEIPKVYALDKKGKIRVFEIGVYEIPGFEDELIGGGYQIKSLTGVLGGKLKATSRTVKEGKNIGKANETTPFEQARLEAISAFKDKLNEGYKSLDDLLRRAESLSIEVENTGVEGDFIPDIFEALKITFNTDTNWRKLPMLAEKWRDFKDKVKYPVITQPKLNGVRCIASYDPDFQEVILSTRGGTVYKVPYLQAQLEPFFLLNQNLELDGEIYFHGKPLQEISGAARKNEKEQPLWLQYHLYDCLLNKPQVNRLEDLRIFVQILKDQYQADKIFLVESDTANDEEDVIKYHNKYVASGYEGAIVRNPSANYMISFRDSCILKVKEFLDEEFELIDCEVDSAKGIDSFVFVLRNNIDNQTFKARPTGTLLQKEIWRAKPEEWVGKKATIRFQERTVGGLPHQGHVRHKDTLPLLECIRDYE